MTMAGGYSISWMIAITLLKLASCNIAACTPSEVDRGEQATVFCHFNASDSLRHIILYMLNEHTKSPKKSIVECSILPDGKCSCNGDYECSSPDLVLTIPSVTEKQVGKYLCQTLPTGDEVSCMIKLKETQDDNCTVEIVILVVLAILAVLLLLLLAYVKRKWIRSKLTCRITREREPPEDGVELLPKEANAETSTTRRLLIIGKSGHGKTSILDTTLKSNLFKIENVRDTPDINEMTNSEQKAQVNEWKEFISNTPYAILLAVKCAASYGHDDHKIYQRIKDLWGNSPPFCQRLVVAFTFGDLLEETDPITIASDELRRVLEDAEHRSVVFNNKANLEGKKEAVQRLLSIVDGLCSKDILSGASCERRNEDNSGQHAPGQEDRQRQTAVQHN